jgi:hypothetical protein
LDHETIILTSAIILLGEVILKWAMLAIISLWCGNGLGKEFFFFFLRILN